MKQRAAISARAMSFGEQAGAHQQIGELGSLETIFSPGNLVQTARPVEALENGPSFLRNRPVEPGVVGDHDCCISDERSTADGSMEWPATISSVMRSGP